MTSTNWYTGDQCCYFLIHTSFFSLIDAKEVQWCEVEPLDNNKPTFKDNLLSICSQRKDDWSEVVNVRLHLQAVVTTVPAYDDYHNDCYQSFRKIPKQNREKDQSRDDHLTHVIKYMESHKQTTWTVSELYEV